MSGTPQAALPYAQRLHRLICPGQGARFDASQALWDLARARSEVMARSADLAAAVGYPAGISQRHATGRLGTALWQIFPGHVALLDRDSTVLSVNRAWRQFGLERGASAGAGAGQTAYRSATTPPGGASRQQPRLPWRSGPPWSATARAASSATGWAFPATNADSPCRPCRSPGCTQAP